MEESRRSKKVKKQHKYIIFTYVFLSFLVLSFSAGVVDASEEIKFIAELNANFKEPIDVDVSEQGDVYVLDKKLSEVTVFDKKGEVKLVFGELGSEVGQMNVPESLALSLKEEIVIADTGNCRVLVFKPNGHYSYQIGSYGSNPGEFRKPTYAAVNPSGYIYVADSFNKTLSKFTPNGVFLDVATLNWKPDDIIFDKEENLYVLFTEEGKVIKYQPSMDSMEEITLIRDEQNLVSTTHRIAIDHRGDVFLVELESHRIIKMSQDQKILMAFGSRGVGRGQFEQPAGIVADDNDRIYIADSRNKRVQVFSQAVEREEVLVPSAYSPPVLEYAESLYTGSEIVDLEYIPEQGLYALSDYSGNIIFMGKNKYVLGRTEENKIDLNFPQAIKVLNKDTLLIADTGNHRLQFINPDGSDVYYFGVKGSDISQFNALQGIAVDEKGYIYVSDTNNHRIQVFNTDGIYLRSFGTRSERADPNGSKPGTFIQPMDLVFDPTGQLYILDRGNKRIQVFDKEGQFVKEIGGVLDEIDFSDPVDMDVDEKGFLYVADKGSYSIKIIDNEGKMVMSFGSSGKGPSYFPSLSAIASSSGKIYVSDYKTDEIKVFDFLSAVPEPEEFLYITRTSQVLDMEQSSEKIKHAMARKLTLDSLKKELVNKVGVMEDVFDNNVKIESENLLTSGQLRLTIRIPKGIVPEGYTILGMK